MTRLTNQKHLLDVTFRPCYMPNVRMGPTTCDHEGIEGWGLHFEDYEFLSPFQ
jgi:hypothetical protein